MKIAKKILLTLCIILIIIGMIILGTNGLNYSNGYTKNILLETAKQYIYVISLSTIIILVYLIIRYNKQGKLKVFLTSLLTIIGTILLTLAIIIIARMPITKLIFSIILSAYVASIVVICAYFEKNT